MLKDLTVGFTRKQGGCINQFLLYSPGHTGLLSTLNNVLAIIIVNIKVFIVDEFEACILDTAS